MRGDAPMRALVLSTLFFVACGAPVSMPDASVEVDSGFKQQPADAGVDAGLPDAGTSDAGIVTVLRVKSPAGTRTVSARGSKPPFNWNTGIAMTKVDSETWTLTVTTLSEDLEWKPLLDDSVWSKGPNYVG